MLQETLPAAWYMDPGIFAREREKIFARNWAFFGPAADVAEPSSWRADVVNGWPVVVTRGEDNVLRAFHNVCRHRGATVMTGEGGKCKLMVCPYHAWGYDLKGNLVNVPNFGDKASLDLTKWGMLPIAVDTWCGLLFVRIAEEGPSLIEWLGSIPKLMKDYPEPTKMTFNTRFSRMGDCNWKAYADNTVEAYHLPAVHPRLNAAVDKEHTDVLSMDNGKLVVFDVGYVKESTDDSTRGPRGIWFYRFPGFQGVMGAHLFKADRIEPVSANRMRYSNWSWYYDLSPEEKAHSQEWSVEVAEEDIRICETVQQNMETGVYRTGVLSPTLENHIARLQQIVIEELAAA